MEGGGHYFGEILSGTFLLLRDGCWDSEECRVTGQQVSVHGPMSKSIFPFRERECSLMTFVRRYLVQRMCSKSVPKVFQKSLKLRREWSCLVSMSHAVHVTSRRIRSIRFRNTVYPISIEKHSQVSSILCHIPHMFKSRSIEKNSVSYLSWFPETRDLWRHNATRPSERTCAWTLFSLILVNQVFLTWYINAYCTNTCPYL